MTLIGNPLIGTKLMQLDDFGTIIVYYLIET